MFLTWISQFDGFSRAFWINFRLLTPLASLSRRTLFFTLLLWQPHVPDLAAPMYSFDIVVCAICNMYMDIIHIYIYTYIKYIYLYYIIGSIIYIHIITYYTFVVPQTESSLELTRCLQFHQFRIAHLLDLVANHLVFPYKICISVSKRGTSSPSIGRPLKWHWMFQQFLEQL